MLTFEAGDAAPISGGICPFPSVEAACNATIATIQSGIPVARIELFDELQVKACNVYSKMTLPESAGVSKPSPRSRFFIAVTLTPNSALSR